MEKLNDVKLWVDDISVLLDTEYVSEFFPRTDMTANRKLNAITRLSIYVSIALFVYNRNINSLFIGLITMTIIYLVNLGQKTRSHYNNMDDESAETKHKTEKCSSTNNNNPFMNVLLTDYQDNPRREAACKTEFDSEIKKQVEDNFNENLYKDVSNVFNKKNSQRQFYTNPATTIPNGQGNFAKWLYGVPKTCKEGNGEQCVANNQYRLNGSSRLPIEIY